MARWSNTNRMYPTKFPKAPSFRLYICACGLSKNKPFCDGSHRKSQGRGRR